MPSGFRFEMLRLPMRFRTGDDAHYRIRQFPYQAVSIDQRANLWLIVDQYDS